MGAVSASKPGELVYTPAFDSDDRHKSGIWSKNNPILIASIFHGRTETFLKSFHFGFFGA